MGSFDRLTIHLHRIYVQGVGNKRLVKYVNHWIKWAIAVMSLDVEALYLTTTKILQNSFGFHVPLKSS